jgi:hypothetical protein
VSAEFPYLNKKLSPFEHQAAHLREHIESEYWALFWQTGACKTLPIIATAAHQYLRGNIELLVVFAPSTVHSNWVRREIPKTLDPKFPYAGYIWRGEHTVKAKKEREAFIAMRGKLKVVSINFEAISAHRTMQTNTAILFLAALMKAHRGKCMGVVDEADGIGDFKATRTSRILKFAPHFKIRRIATGTPNTESAFQLYSQSEFLQHGLLGYNSYESFEITHGIFKMRKFGKGKEFRMCVGYRGMDYLREKVKAFSSVVRKSDCMDLPDKLFERRSVELTVEQKSAYAQMCELLIHEVKNLEGATEYAMAKNALHKLRKLHEVVLGFARVEVPYTGDPEKKPKNPVYKTLPLTTNRPKVLLEILDGLEGKALVFTDCVPALEQLVTLMREKYGEKAVGAIYGKVTGVARDEVIDAFEDLSSEMRFIVLNQKTGGIGITLIAAQTVIFYSNGYSLRMRIQSEDRAHRGGQTKNVTYIDMVAEDTVDEKVLDLFEHKIDIASQILPLFDVFLGKRILTPDERAALQAAKYDATMDLYSELLEG